jgi:hypothetical protein
MSRDELEKAALNAVSADMYYDLLDCIGETTNDELHAIAGLL